MGLLPSIVYFESSMTMKRLINKNILQYPNYIMVNPNPSGIIINKQDLNSTKKKYFICACSMIQNQAPFLKEWIMYHSYLGIERWYLYDNNSDDEFEEVLSESLLQFNVTHHVWPWRNVEEACMSHCALRAQDECEWVMFTHVDEFLYPINYIYGNKRGMYNNNYSILERFIKMETERVWGPKGANHVAEIRLHCFDYGPSGLTQPPEEGVMVGYTCRTKTPKRHKSIVRVDALNDSLLNVVHHFSIKPKFRAITIHQNIAVINHYKYQVVIAKPLKMKNLRIWHKASSFKFFPIIKY
jgi:hypothetical protein